MYSGAARRSVRVRYPARGGSVPGKTAHLLSAAAAWLHATLQRRWSCSVGNLARREQTQATPYSLPCAIGTVNMRNRPAPKGSEMVIGEGDDRGLSHGA